MKLLINAFTKHSMQVVCCICAVLLTFSYSKAQTLLTENFNYTQGTLLTSDNWTALAGTGTNNVTVSNGNLAYPGSIGDGMGNKVPLANNGQDVYRAFTSTVGSVYSSLVVNVSAADATGDYFYSIGTGATHTTVGAKLFVKSNGAGFSFGVLRGSGGIPVYETTVRPFNTNIMVVLKYESIAGLTNDAVKLFVNPALASEPATPDAIYAAAVGTDATALSSIALFQGTIANAPTLQVDGINVGNTWASISSTVYDYGDVPTTYDFTKDGVYAPAVHSPLTGLFLGTVAPDFELSPLSVASGADNNGSNGDGADEDAIVPSANPIRKGATYTLSVPVTNPTAVAKYLYGWIDFNNDGLFQLAELAGTTVAPLSITATGATTQTLTWSAAKTATLVGSSKVYMRLRLSNRLLNDFTTAASGGALIDERSVGNGAFSAANAADFPTVAGGEVEDYQLDILNTLDYGDVPSSFENDKDGNALPAVHAPFTGFSIGLLLDIEDNPASVASPNENNTAGDNSIGIIDEDGITAMSSISRGVAYNLTIPVNIPSALAGTKYLYGWLDLNGDGRFQSTEFATVNTTLTGESFLTLTWTPAQTLSIASGTSKIYLRLRLSNVSLFDFTGAAGGTVIDERSVGNGATSLTVATNALTLANGEVEDYQLPVDLYDFGDAPASYEINNASASVPARHTANTANYIGAIVDEEPNAQSVAAGADNNGTNGDGADEDSFPAALPVITKGAPFSFSVSQTAEAASNIIAWVDFNNDGKFQASEASYASAAAATPAYQATGTGTAATTFWFKGAQTNTIPNGVNNLYVRVRLTRTAGADNAATAGVDERSIGDGASSGIYTLPIIGEVEDYRFAVATNFDFGDTPISYDMDKDGLVNPANYKPARNFASDALFLGMTYTLEPAPLSVAAGANNNAPNGDGISDNGLTSAKLNISTGVANSYTVAVNNATGAAATLYAWIDFNNNGRFESTEFATAAVAANATTATVNFTLAQANAIAAATGKVYMRLRFTDTAGVDLTAGANNAVVDERAIADGANTGSYTVASFGEVEDYQLTVIRDYGDVPSSYENGSPASQSNSVDIANPELTIGATIDYELTNSAVASGADNNGTNGDGADEDGLAAPQTITAGSTFSLKVPINTTVTGTKNLYAWIDFNGDGIFNGNEAAALSASVTAGTTNEFILTWPATATNASPLVLTAGKTYVRFRLSGAALTNSNNANLTLIDSRSFGAGTAAGEIQDYQFAVSNLYDYGDAPVEYSRARDGIALAPARQAPSSVLRLGSTIDTELSAQSVVSGANNNGTNGDGADEDGITSVMPVYKGTAYYSKVSVFNNSGLAKTLYGWIDLDNDGYFEATEVASISVPSSNTQQTVTLPWTVANTNTIPVGVNQLYMRLRISDGTLADFTAGAQNAVVDERSIGDGLNTGAYGTANGGEIEDYLLPVITEYDFGDAALSSYDTSRNNVVAPARQAVSQGLYIGDNPADYEASKQIQTGNALGDDTTGIDDEDGVAISPIYTGGGSIYSLNVKVTNNTGAARTLYGWIDFNNNGRFEATEVRTVSVPNATNNGNVILTWPAASTVITGSPNQLYMRLRLSEGTLADFATGAPGLLVDERALADGLNTGEYAVTPVIYNGEIEDHTIPVTSNLDYGDAPVSYEQNTSGVNLPARHIPDMNLIIGNTIDTEPAPQNVAAGTDSNGTNGDGLDEDGTTYPLTTMVSGSDYATLVNVTNNLATTATLHGWIDMDGNGKFTADEYTSTVIAVNSGGQSAKLYWPTTTFTGSGSNTYMRVRLTSAAFADNVATTNVDERSIGDGLSTGINAAFPANGEIEDYYLPVDTTPAVLQSCDPTDDRLGLNAPIKALYHGSIIRAGNGDFLVFGSNANGNGTSDQNTPAKLQSGFNGFNFKGSPLMVTGFSHQYFLLSTAGLYAWGSGYGGNLFAAPLAMSQVPMPPGVSPANVQMIDAGQSNSIPALTLVTKSGEVWVQPKTTGSNIQGDGNLTTTGWHQVMIDDVTPLSGIKDARNVGASAIATDGTNLYTWGDAVSLGNGQIATNKAYATKMQPPTGISVPVKQLEISKPDGGSTSYYVRDSAGKVFVLGENGRGQLGVGNTMNAKSWLTITQMNEQPNAPGVQTDITKPIKKVIWISASNSDGFYPHFALITEEFKDYTVASRAASAGGIASTGGAPNSTSDYIPTAATIGGGATLLPGKFLFVGAGGHISILIKDKNDRYGYVGHTAQGSDGCGGCTNNPNEFNFNGPPSTGPVCGNTAFDYGDLDERYNLGDMASHEIKYAQADNPLRLGAIAGDSDDAPQFTVSGSSNNADGDDTDGKSAGDDEDAITGTLPAKVTGVSYTLTIPFTNNTGTTAYLYGSIDWNNNGIFEPGETAVQSVSASASQQTVSLTWADPGAISGCNGEALRSFVRLRLTTTVLSDDTATPQDERSFVKADDGEVEDYYLDWTCGTAFCYKPGITSGTALDSKVGITSLSRAGATDPDNWPMVRKGAWLVLESKTKGFVVNRLPFDGSGNPIGIPVADFTEGMMVYDTVNNCLKMYTSTDGGSTLSWQCLNTQTCPD